MTEVEERLVKKQNVREGIGIARVVIGTASVVIPLIISAWHTHKEKLKKEDEERERKQKEEERKAELEKKKKEQTDIYNETKSSDVIAKASILNDNFGNNNTAKVDALGVLNYWMDQMKKDIGSDDFENDRTMFNNIVEDLTVNARTPEIADMYVQSHQRNIEVYKHERERREEAQRKQEELTRAEKKDYQFYRDRQNEREKETEIYKSTMETISNGLREISRIVGY